MSSVLQYHEVKPINDNVNDGFTEFGVIDLVLMAEGRKYKANSFLLDFDLECNSAGNTAVVNADDIKIDRRNGGHNFIESISEEIESKGLISQISEYSRVCKLIETSTKNENDIMTVGENAEGKELSEESARYHLQRQSARAEGTDGNYIPVSDLSNFCIKPKCAINSMSSTDYSFDKNGYIKVSINLARLRNALYGTEMTGNVNYSLKNVKGRFVSVPDDGKQQTMIMNTFVTVKNTISSQQASVKSRVPSKAVNGVAIHFLKQSDELSLTENSNQLQSYPKFDSVNYLFSDTQSNGITYKIDTLEDALKRGVDSLRVNLSPSVSFDNVVRNNGTILGLDFEESLDLTQNPFTMNIKSKDNGISATPLNVYLTFLCLVSL